MLVHFALVQYLRAGGLRILAMFLLLSVVLQTMKVTVQPSLLILS